MHIYIYNNFWSVTKKTTYLCGNGARALKAKLSGIKRHGI